MKRFHLAALILLSACGSEKKDGKDDTQGNVLPGIGSDGDSSAPSFLTTNEYVKEGCFAEATEDFESDSWSFSKGDKFLLSKLTLFFDKYEAYYSTAPESGAASSLDLPKDKVTFNCTDYQSKIVALSDVKLFSDKNLTQAGCTITAGTIGNVVMVGGIAAVGNDYSFDAKFGGAIGTCAGNITYYAKLPSVAVAQGNSLKISAMTPLITVYFPK